METKKIQVVLVEPGERAKITEIESHLGGLQDAVGGHLEATYPFEEEVCCVCNEEGKLIGMPLNRALKLEGSGLLYDIIAGPFFICDCSGERFGSLTDEQALKYQDMFEMPEMFFRGDDGQIISMPYEPDEIETLDSMIDKASDKCDEQGRDGNSLKNDIER